MEGTSSSRLQRLLAFLNSKVKATHKVVLEKLPQHR